MVTKEQALAARYSAEFHHGICKRITGPRGGVKETTVRVRVSGMCRTWKTRPSEFRLPIKYGMYQSLYIDDVNADEFHTAADCPLLKRETAETV